MAACIIAAASRGVGGLGVAVTLGDVTAVLDETLDEVVGIGATELILVDEGIGSAVGWNETSLVLD